MNLELHRKASQGVTIIQKKLTNPDFMKTAQKPDACYPGRTWQKITKLRKNEESGLFELPAKLKSEAFFEQIRELCESGHSPRAVWHKIRELGAFCQVSSSGNCFRFSGFVLLPSLSRDFPAFRL